MKVAKKPATRCQSIWQWNAQTRIGSRSVKGSFEANSDQGTLGYLSGLFAIKRNVT